MKNIAKKVLLSVAIVSLVLVMASCDSLFGGMFVDKPQNEVQTTKPQDITTPDETTGPQDITNPENEPDVKETFCKELSSLYKDSYERIELQVATTTKGVTLNSQFVLSAREVEYSIEKLSSFQIGNDGTIVAPESFKETHTGSVMLGDKNDSLIFDGEILEISNYHVLTGNFNFESHNVGQYQRDNAENKKVTFEVLDASEFLGTKIDGAKNMIVIVTYSQTDILEMTVKYATDATQVVINYTFH